VDGAVQPDNLGNQLLATTTNTSSTTMDQSFVHLSKLNWATASGRQTVIDPHPDLTIRLPKDFIPTITSPPFEVADHLDLPFNQLDLVLREAARV
jgi:hypothetical protein